MDNFFQKRLQNNIIFRRLNRSHNIWVGAVENSQSTDNDDTLYMYTVSQKRIPDILAITLVRIV